MTKRLDTSAPPVGKPSVSSSAPVRATRKIAKQGLAFSPGLALAISYVSPTELAEYSNNPRTHTPDQIGKIAESIKAFGFVSPLIIDADGGLIAGHGRMAAAKLLGLERVPVICLHHLNHAQLKALRIADNRLAELAGWDQDLLAIEFSSLLELDGDCDPNFELEITGFSFGAIDQTIEAAKKGDVPDPDDCFEANFEGPTISRLGDLWLMDEHCILCGGARDDKVHARALDGSLAQAAICNPPYNVKSEGHISGLGKVRHPDFVMASGEMSGQEFTTFLTVFLCATSGSLVAGGVLFVFMDWRHQREILDAARSVGLTLLNVCVWNKGMGGMGSLYRSQHEFVFVLKKGNASHKNRVELGRHGRCRTNVWSYPGLASFGPNRTEQLADHPTIKNCAMIADAIRDVSDRNDIVMDPFCGSGTTILAAAKIGRRARTIELDPKYVDVAVRRWEKWSGKQARHADTGSTFAEVAARRASNPEVACDPNPSVHESLTPPPARVRKRIRAA
ncbi:site-specific DNA-methyltransferase [Methylocapsa sp. D3K7]|uniref:site-specific DNA-methyltransferase n=1 Tax=Methylocapsa sp. D3K7 TaxID=3041435 RepID=UPI00244E63F4|nr:DNA methyltransferase [Methylocapsa sp. D3K7]WGJ16359.1 site-specific DNA-methyltransferase [Methylocapsa sp. D3K7]